MKKEPHDVSIGNVCDTLDGFWLGKGLIKGLGMRSNRFSIDQSFLRVDQYTEVFTSVVVTKLNGELKSERELFTETVARQIQDKFIERRTKIQPALILRTSLFFCRW